MAKFQKKLLEKDIKELGLKEGQVVYVPLEEVDTKDIKAEHPGVLELPDGAFVDWGEDKLVSHLVKLAKKIGRDKVSPAINNIRRWNSKKNPKLSQKATNIMDKYLKKLEEK